MPFSVVARLISTALTDRRHESIDFIWHGGETTVLPISFYKRALLLQSRFRRVGQRVVNGIQTNGTRLTPAWARFFRDNEFRVGISLDGPPVVHDRYRRYASGRESFADVSDGMRLLRDYGVPFGVLMVIDQGALEVGPDAIFDFFVEHGVKSFGLLPAKPSNQAEAEPGTIVPHYVDPQTMTAFWIRLYDYWCEWGDPEIRIRELDGLIKQINNQKSGFCTLAGRCFGNFFIVEPDGKVAHCELFVGDERYTVGSILREDFETMRQSQNMSRLQKQNDQALVSMGACPEFAVCNGWCPHERYTSLRHNPSHRADCCGLREVIAYIRSHLDRAPKLRRVPTETTSRN